MKTYTYEPWLKTSVQAHEHLTVRYANGTMSALSRDEIKSVRPKWDVIGTYFGSDSNPSYVCFTEDSFATRMVASYLAKHGTNVNGVNPDDHKGSVIRLETKGCRTNPDSIRGRIRDRNPGNPRDKRRAVQKRFGGMGTCDVQAMRDAIEARKSK